MDGDLPTAHLQRLPEWCVYVELDGSGLAGFFAYLDYNIYQSQQSLRIVLDDPKLPNPLSRNLVLHLNDGTLKDAIEGLVRNSIALLAGQQTVPDNFAAEAHALAALPEKPEEKNRHVEYIRQLAEPLVSVILYLCAGEAEMRPTREPKRTHGPPSPKRDRDGQLYVPPARRPEVWETGFQLGAAIRAAEENLDADHGRSPRGHIRRAHWHSYWLGSGESRHLELRWLPPIPVKLELPERPTRHRVDRRN